MKQITKTDFISTVTEFETYFMGLTRVLPEDSYLLNEFNRIKDREADGKTVNKRTAVPYAKGVKFSDGSILDIYGKNINCYSDIFGQLLMVDIEYDRNDLFEFEGVAQHKYLFYVVM